MTDHPNQLGTLILSKLNPIQNTKPNTQSNPNSKSKSNKSNPSSNLTNPSKSSQITTTSKPIHSKSNQPKPTEKHKSKSTSKEKTHQTNLTDEKLSKFIKELGGDEDDLEMIKNLKDDDDDDDDQDLILEDHSNSNSNINFKTELQSLVKGLNFDQTHSQTHSKVSKLKEPILKKKKKKNEETNELIQSQSKSKIHSNSSLKKDLISTHQDNQTSKSNQKEKDSKDSEKKVNQKEKNLKDLKNKVNDQEKKVNQKQKNPNDSEKKLNDQENKLIESDSLTLARQSKQEAKSLQRRLEAIRSHHHPNTTTIQEEKVRFKHLSDPSSSWSIEPKPTWYDTSYLPPLPSTTKSRSLTPDQIKSLHARGQFVLTTISTQYTESLRPSQGKPSKTSFTTHSIKSTISESDKTFIHKILTAGTSSDKLSALILLISSSPLLSISHFNALLSICKKKSRDESGKAIRGLVDWLKGHSNSNSSQAGLPDRKLKFFADQNEGLLKVYEMRSKSVGLPHLDEQFQGKVMGDEWLAVWCFEDWFKKWYLEFLGIIEISSHDVLVFNRIQSVSWIYYLLSSKPEQEQNLLRLLVNKLGDREKSVCSRTGFYLLQILQLHPFMKSIIIREISSLMFKFDDSKSQTESIQRKTKELSKVQDHSRYYGTITLNQIILVKDQDELVAKKLIEVYFELFKEILGQTEQEEEGSGEVEELNEEEIEEKELKRKEKLRQKKGKKKLEAEEEEELTIKERKAKLLSAILTGLNRALPYGKIDDDRLKNEIENLFKILHASTLSVTIQSLTLISHLIKFHSLSIQDRFYRSLYLILLDYRLVHSVSQHALFLNLLFKSIKEDKCLERVESFIRRIVQVLSFHQAPFICSTLVLLDDLMTTSHPSCRRLIQLSSSSKSLRETRDEATENEDGSEVKNETYDGKKREPKFANASSFPLWEIEPLLSHYHPSVRLNTTEFISSESKVTSIIDLNETHSLNQFLDRFVYKKCTKKNQIEPQTKVKGISIMQPSLHDRIGKTNKDHRSKEVKELGRIEDEGIGFEEFGKLGIEDVNVDQIFLHQYFRKRYEEGHSENEKKSKKSKRGLDREGNEGEGDYGGKGGSDDGSEEEDELNEDEVWKAMKRSMGDDLGGMSEDEDEDEEGLEGLMDDDEEDDDDDEDDDDEGFEGLSGEEFEGIKDGEFEGFDEEDEEEGDEELMIEDMEDLMGFDESESEEERMKSNQMKSKRIREEEEEEEEEEKKEKKRVKNEKKKRWSGKGGGVFASAEEFREMLEEEEDEEL
ncbi:CBF/Mak21 family-domain-containing protein [Melampsora americana]|nr:CBF/Mak21 family-domain-containing protein [Melampsora americana]